MNGFHTKEEAVFCVNSLVQWLLSLISLQQEYAKQMEEKAKKIAEEKERREREAQQLKQQLDQANAAKTEQMKKLSALSTPDAVHIQDTHGETDDVSFMKSM